MPYALTALSGPYHTCLSWRGHNRFWCYSDRRSAYGVSLSDHLYSLRSWELLFLSVMACHSLMRTQANPLCLS